jgi:hypothetical protein
VNWLATWYLTVADDAFSAAIFGILRKEVGWEYDDGEKRCLML